MTMLTLLLENVGIDAVVKLGDVETWQAAPDARKEREHADRARASEPVAGSDAPANPSRT